MFDFQNLNYDLDGDGILDSYAEEADLNGDGIAETVLIDTDNDGLFDTLFSDADGDMYMETVAADTNMDGVFDTAVVEYDTDFDGDIDTVETYVDGDTDSEADVVFVEQLLDTDGDGIEDTYSASYSTDGGNEFEVIEVYDFSDSADYIEPLDYNEETLLPDASENFDPDSVNPEDVSGDPEESMEVWEFQGDTNRCAVYSQKFVIEEITGRDIDIEELADLAEENGWFSEEGGTSLLDMNKILDHYGIENDMTFYNDADDIKECLDNGGKVIVSVDADEIWYGDDDSIFTPDDGVNHAVQVIGIDYSNPDEPMVILNDSGTPDGCGEMVPMDVFMDAWEDGNCQMVSCM